MNILLDSNNVAVFVGMAFELKEDGVFFTNSYNSEYSTANASVIDADAPYPALSHVWKWENDAWVCIDQEAVDAYLSAQKAAFNESQRQKREAAYKAESDPINFMMQRDEATQEEWLAKIAEIKARFPYQE
jgi:hypothetical protein